MFRRNSKGESGLILIQHDPCRWKNYNLIEPEHFEDFWKSHNTEENKILFILGHGFDPRMCIGFQSILNNHSGSIDLMVVKYGNQLESRLTAKACENLDKLSSLISTKVQKIDCNLETTSKNKTTAESRKITEIFSDKIDFVNYSDIIVDISALPIRLYFPLCGKILHMLEQMDKEKNIPNFHIIVAENQLIDSKIKEIEIEDRANYLYSFASNLGNEAGGKPNVWIPLLGENTDKHLEKIQTLVKPEEICPLFPSPSINPRRGDDLILEYVDLFSKLNVETRNFVYGAEQNPFEAYRQIMETIHNYPKVFVSKGGCNVALSALTSKLLTLSAFFVAIEMKAKKDLSVGIAHISAKTYDVDYAIFDSEIINKSKLFSLWVSGTCYE